VETESVLLAYHSALAGSAARMIDLVVRRARVELPLKKLSDGERNPRALSVSKQRSPYRRSRRHLVVLRRSWMLVRTFRCGEAISFPS